MSLVLVAHDAHPRYSLIVAANRDDFHRRELLPAAWWDDAPQVLASRDPETGGAWLGITREGRFAAITQYRDPKKERDDLPSPELIVSDYLTGTASGMETLRTLSARPRQDNPFTILVHDGTVLAWGSSRVRGARRLEPGVYGLSNHLLGTPWHKVKSGTSELRALLDADAVSARDLLALLDERSEGPPETLPRTGVGEERERWLSPRFVVGYFYGTRTSTVLLVSRAGEVEVVERNFDPQGVEIATERSTFSIEPRQRVA